MNKVTTFTFLLLVFAIQSFSQGGFNTFITYLKSIPEDHRMAVVDSFMIAAEPYGFPYITGDSANFIYRGNATSVKIVGDMTDWASGLYYLAKVSGTDFFYRSKIFEMTARVEYQYILNEINWTVDPLNPSPAGCPNSVLTMPEYTPPWEINIYPGVPQGTSIDGSITSTYMGQSYMYKIYLPPGYNSDLQGGYPVVYFQDGFDYLNMGFADRVLDNIIDSNLCSPVIGVFVKPNNRNEEYAGSLREEYQLFFAEELVPFIDGEYNTIRQARARAVIGDSYGGNISALICYNYADVFGNCGMHSGAIFPNNYEAFYLIAGGEVKSIRWASIWGTYEGLWEINRMLKDSLIYDEYDVLWNELPEGHNWTFWKANIDNMLSYFFPAGFMGTDNRIKLELMDVRIYPNPFSDHITFQY